MGFFMTTGSVNSTFTPICPPAPRKGLGPIGYENVITKEYSNTGDCILVFGVRWGQYPIEGDGNRPVQRMTETEKLDAAVSEIFATYAKTKPSNNFTPPEIYMDGVKCRKLNFSE